MLDEKLFKKIREITIPEYIYQIQTSNARLTKYYHKDSGRTKVQRPLDKIPKKFKAWGYDLEGYVLDENNNRIIANSRTAGTPKFIPINGQIYYSQTGGKFTRAKMAKALHEFFEDKVKNFKPFKDKEYPLVIQMNWYAPYKWKTMDSSNMFFVYQKSFEDSLTNLGIIKDDEVRYVSGGFPIYTPCEKFEDRKLVFSFYQDMRAEINQLKLL